MHFFITKTHNLHLNFFFNQSAFIWFCIVLKHFPQKSFFATTYFCYFGKERSLDRQSIDMVTSYRHFCRVFKWLERQDCDRWSWFKTYSHHSVVSLGKTLNGTLPCLVILASSSKLKSYLYQSTSGLQYLGISGRWSG